MFIGIVSTATAWLASPDWVAGRRSRSFAARPRCQACGFRNRQKTVIHRHLVAARLDLSGIGQGEIYPVRRCLSDDRRRRHTPTSTTMQGGQDGMTLMTHEVAHRRAELRGILPLSHLQRESSMETFILIAALLYKHPTMPEATTTAVQVEFATAEACNNALQKVKAEWGSPTGVNVYAVCVPSGFKRAVESGK